MEWETECTRHSVSLQAINYYCCSSSCLAIAHEEFVKSHCHKTSHRWLWTNKYQGTGVSQETLEEMRQDKESAERNPNFNRRRQRERESEERKKNQHENSSHWRWSYSDWNRDWTGGKRERERESQSQGNDRHSEWDAHRNEKRTELCFWREAHEPSIDCKVSLWFSASVSKSMSSFSSCSLFDYSTSLGLLPNQNLNNTKLTLLPSIECLSSISLCLSVFFLPFSFVYSRFSPFFASDTTFDCRSLRKMKEKKRRERERDWESEKHPYQWLILLKVGNGFPERGRDEGSFWVSFLPLNSINSLIWRES